MLRLLSCLPTFFLALAVVFAAPALAGDDEPAYGAADLAMEEESMPEGWTILYDEVPDSPGEAIEEWATNVARSAGLDEDALIYETRLLQLPDGSHVTVLLVEVDGDAGTLPQKLAKAAESEGWITRIMGDPRRLLVVAGSAAVRGKVLELQMHTSVATLTRLAHERSESGSVIGSAEYAHGALALEPNAGMPHAVLGLAANKVDKFDEAIAEFGKAFAKDAVLKPEGALAHWAWRTFGYVLLKSKTREDDSRAVDALEHAIETADVLEGKKPVFPIHYNLACALSRLERTKEACERLEVALRMALDRMGPHGFRQYLNGRVMHDVDFDNIRDEPCFDAMIERVTEGIGSSPLDGI